MLLQPEGHLRHLALSLLLPPEDQLPLLLPHAANVLLQLLLLLPTYRYAASLSAGTYKSPQSSESARA